MKRTVAGLVVVVCAFALAGCSPANADADAGAGAGGGAGLRASVASSPEARWASAGSPEPVPVVSEEEALRERVLSRMPSIASTETIQGGVAVAKVFVVEHPKLFQEGPSELFEFLSLPECEFCASEQERAQREIQEWGLQVGGDMVVDTRYTFFKLDTEKFDEPTLIVSFLITEQPYTFVNDAGEVTRSGGSTELRAALALQVRDGIWRVRTFFFEEVEPEEIPPEIRELLERGPDA